MEDFKDICPVDDSEFKQTMAKMIDEPGFKHAISYVLPMVDYPAFTRQLMTLDSKDSFQRNIMVPFIEMLANKTTAGISMDGLEYCSPDRQYTFISNHRDIILDASLLNVLLLRNGFSASEIALGDNLLIYEWIERLVKLNKGFIVKRNLRKIEAFKAAQHLSAYIHHCILDKRESVWIAQREGRAKDSNDRTQESVIKMLALAKSDNVVEALLELNITPVTISYEYDPNDFLKATEFLCKRNNPDFVKSQRDDLLSMETGLLGQKGRVHYRISASLNPVIETLRGSTDKNHIFSTVCAALDRQIHLGYALFPSNYISYDRLNGSNRFSYRYTAKDAADFDRYIESQLDKVRLDNITDDDRQYMRHMMLTMYANPLVNKLRAMGKEV